MTDYRLDYIDPPLLEITKEYASKTYSMDSELKISTFPDAKILPFTPMNNSSFSSGVLDNQDFFIKGSSQFENIKPLEHVPSKVKTIDEDVLYIGVIRNIWGHFITDSIARLWAFIPIKNKHKIAYSGTKLDLNDSNFLEVLSLFGITYSDLIYVDELTKFKSVTIPDKSLIYSFDDQIKYSPKYSETINHIVNQVVAKSKVNSAHLHEKLYFTRSRLNNWRDTGEKQIELLFKKQGYKIIAPEKLTFLQQVIFLNNCKTFATTEGSISHNALFINPKSEIIIIRKAPTINPYSFMINELRSLKVTYIDAHLSLFLSKERRWEGPFFLYINDNLARYFNIHKPVINKQLFYQYVKRNLHSGNFGLSELDPYYLKKVDAEFSQKSNSKVKNILRSLYLKLIKR